MKTRNFVAKFQRKFNKAKVFVDQKRESKKRGLDDYEYEDALKEVTRPNGKG